MDVSVAPTDHHVANWEVRKISGNGFPLADSVTMRFNEMMFLRIENVVGDKDIRGCFDYVANDFL